MAEPPIELFKAVAHPMRYAILAALAGGELNVGEIESATAIGQPTLSQQLSVLRKAGLIVGRREAKLVFYRTDEEAIAEAHAALAALMPTGRDGAIRDAGWNRRGGAAVFARLEDG